MLVLSRKAGEKLRIGDDITVTVAKIAGNRVRIGIDAPENVRIVRAELDQWNVLTFGESAPRKVAAQQPCLQP